jgi:hypothetical protein
MSSQNARLTDFTPPETEIADAPPEWSPQQAEDNAENQSQCQSCGNHVSRDFARVFGNNDGEVWACRDCTTATAIRGGATRSEDADGTRNLANTGTGGPGHVR